MKHSLLCCALAALALSASCRSVNATSFEAETALSSAFVFRGLHLNDGPGVASRGRVGLSRADGSTISGSVSGYLDLSGDPGDAVLEAGDTRFSRIDLSARWEKKIGGVQIALGMNNYNFPNVSTTSTSELFASAEHYTVALHPRATLYYDVQNADDFYLRVGVHPRKEFDRSLVGELGFDVGYMADGQSQFWYGTSESGLSDALLTGRVTYLRDEHFRAFLGISAAQVLDSGLKDQVAASGFDDSVVWAYIGCGWTY